MGLNTTIIIAILGLLALLGMAAFAGLSLKEGELRAASIALTFGFAIAMFLLLISQLPLTAKLIFLAMAATGGIAAVVIFVLSIGQVECGHDVPENRFDERDVIFARANLTPGSPEYDAYCNNHTENRVVDDKFRNLPGLLSFNAHKVIPLFSPPQMRVLP